MMIIFITVRPYLQACLFPGHQILQGLTSQSVPSFCETLSSYYKIIYFPHCFMLRYHTLFYKASMGFSISLKTPQRIFSCRADGTSQTELLLYEHVHIHIHTQRYMYVCMHKCRCMFFNLTLHYYCKWPTTSQFSNKVSRTGRLGLGLSKCVLKVFIYIFPFIKPL